MAPRSSGSCPRFVGDGLDGAGLLGALRALDPAPIRDEVNTLFDEAGQFLAGLGDVVVAAFEEIATAAEDLLLPLNPSALLGLVDAASTQGVLAQVEALAPATLAEHVRLVFAAVRRQLEALDPAQLADAGRRRPRGAADALDAAASTGCCPTRRRCATCRRELAAAAAEPAAGPGDGGARPDQSARRGHRRRRTRAAAGRRHRPHQGAGARS